MSGYLVDTNILSEPLQAAPNPAVEAWLETHQSRLYTSAITIGELAFGIELLPAGAKRTRLTAALARLIRVLGEGRILSFDTRSARVWGKLQAELERQGHRMPVEDSYIAAIALRHNLTLVTRNTADFDRSAVRTFNPFAPGKHF